MLPKFITTPIANLKLALEKRAAKRLVKAWIKNLRSGKFVQTSGALKDTRNRHCVFGVLCETYNELYPGKLKIKKWINYYTINGRVSGLPSIIGEKAFLVGFPCEKRFIHRLSVLNDSGWDFNKLANYIESEPPGLFKTKLGLK